MRAEVISYKIRKFGFNVGQATLTFAGRKDFENRSLDLIIFKADGFNFYDEEKIYLDPDTFCPVLVERDLDIFGKKEKIVEEYSNVEGKITIAKESGGKKTRQVLQKRGVIDNIYGFIYRYRHQGLFKIGEILNIRLPTKDFKIELIKQVKLAAAEKDFDCFYMESDPAQYKIWFDTGPQKLPLRISGAVGLANAVMIMTGYKE